MKGIAHFISGVTAASFCPWAYQAAVDGNPLYFILGGVFGILPDTADFKFYRFFFRHNVYIEPDPKNPDPQVIADTLAKAIGDAVATRKAVRVKLSTIRLGGDYWQQYIVRFEPKTQEVLVRFGAVVNTGQVPVPGTLGGERPVGRAKLACPIVQTYDATTRVDIFDGPTFTFEPDAQGRVVLHFLPWHRNWSHSFVVGGFFAALGWLIWGWQAAVVIFAGMAAHILEDQMGLMGSNLFFPITRKRFAGLHLMRSGDALPNFAVVWTCCLLIFWNLYRFMPDPVYRFSFLKLMLYGGVIPGAIYGVALHVLSRRAAAAEEKTVDMADEFGDEMAQ